MKKTEKMHKIPSDLQKIISSSKELRLMWESITPLARNEFICWITSAKKSETRELRVKRACAELLGGKRRPCCWAGCPHR